MAGRPPDDERLPGETDAAFARRIAQKTRKAINSAAAYARKTQGGRAATSNGQNPHAGQNGHSGQNRSTGENPILTGQNTKSTPNSDSSSIQKRPSSRPPDGPKRKTLFGREVTERPAPLRRDIPLDPPVLTVINGGVQSTSTSVPQTVATAQPPDGQKPPPILSGILTGIMTAEASGGVGVPPLGGGDPTPLATDGENQNQDTQTREIIPERILTASSTGENPKAGENAPDTALEALLRDMRSLVTETRYRFEQAVRLDIQILERLDRQERLLTKEPEPPPPPLFSAEPGYVAASDELVAAEKAKDVLLLAAGSTADGLAPLNVPALERADERLVAATEKLRAAGEAVREKKRGGSIARAVALYEPGADQALLEVLERGFRFELQRMVPREQWKNLLAVDDRQRVALHELYLQAVSVARSNQERGFAIYMKWCEACAKDATTDHFEKSARHMLLSPDLCSSSVELGPEDTWWTPEKVRTAWRKQIET
jgi:hypothetical protein